MAAAVRDRSPAPFGAELAVDALAGGEVVVQDPDLVHDGVLHGSSQELVYKLSMSWLRARSKINEFRSF